MKKILYIVFAALLVLGPAGAAAFPHSPDCAMECCAPSMNDDTLPVQAAPCCGTEEATCCFEDSQAEGLFGEALRGFTPAERTRLKAALFSLLTAESSSQTPKPLHSCTLRPSGLSAQKPLYLTNAAFLC